MAPQVSSYGALEMSDHDKKKPVRWPKVVAGILVLATVGVFAFTQRQAGDLGSRVMDVEASGTSAERHRGRDCSCAVNHSCQISTGVSSGTSDANGSASLGFTNDGLHYCPVEPSSVTDTCIGVNNESFVVLDDTKGCVWTTDDIGSAKEGGTVASADVGKANENCMVVCEYVYGRYDCTNFPCQNGGFCLDGEDAYVCMCADGYNGVNCESDIDECSIEDVDSDNDGTVESSEPTAVCDPNAVCDNMDGSYSCMCSAGWEGDGYREYTKVSTPSWVTRPVFEWVPARCSNSAYNSQTTCEGASATWYDAKCSNEADAAAGTRTATTTKVGCGLVVQDGTQSSQAWLQACRDIDACENNPCRNEGECINEMGRVGTDDFTCRCVMGPTGRDAAWVGHLCQDDVDECDPDDPKHDCDDHAECVNTLGGFTCNCKDNWISADENGIDRLGRQWANDAGEYMVGCFDYKNCDNDTPCQNGGSCFEGPSGCEIVAPDGSVSMTDCYTCDCAHGYTGFDCERDENECVDSDGGVYNVARDNCSENAFCTNTPGSFECACNAGWTGTGVVCIDADDCEYSPCAHGGTCYDCGTLCFSCDCVAGWRGTTCGTDWNECLMGIHQCNDEATCVNNPGSYDCRCDPGFTGDGFGPGFEEVSTVVVIGATTITEVDFKGCKDIDDCDPDLYEGADLSPEGPCKMGFCNDVGPNAYVCTCREGYTDSNCDMDINECDPMTGENSCHRFADCINTTGSYNCACQEGFEGNGVNCLDKNDCAAHDCSGHGFCSDLGVNEFKCTCDDGWTDVLCGTNVNECALYTHECARHADCEDIETNGDCRGAGFTNDAGSGYCCRCNAGYAGDGWNLSSGGSTGCIDVDDCASNPCDRGECTDQGENAYTCECEEGFTDFNCDFDVNECYLGTHDCHVEARCVNDIGGYFCRCLAGWEGDGYTCVDLDDCDPDPCDPEHGSCEDVGANKYQCNCDPGWVGFDCAAPEDECGDRTHNCDANAQCENSYGSYTCACDNDFWGDGKTCTPCTVCPIGFKSQGVCEVVDLQCINVDECADETDNCDAHASCEDTEGSFKCECVQNGPGDEWWGNGAEEGRAGARPGCTACTECFPGYHEVQPCTSTTNRQCAINVPNGLYMIESEADDDRQCVSMMSGEWYPTRINFGNGNDYCGMMGGDACNEEGDGYDPARCRSNKIDRLVGDGQALWRFKHLFGNVASTPAQGGDLYSISHDSANGGACLFFGDGGKDVYPSLQNCDSYSLLDKGDCPWDMGGDEVDYCGFTKDGMEPLDALVQNGQAIWKVTPLKLNENKFLLQSASRGNTANGSLTDALWECLTFEQQGAATNPSRYNWGNGDDWCGAGDWEGQGEVYALLNNKQAVFILTYLQG